MKLVPGNLKMFFNNRENGRSTVWTAVERAQMIQSKPESGRGLQVQVLETIQVVHSSLGSGMPTPGELTVANIMRLPRERNYAWISNPKHQTLSVSKWWSSPVMMTPCFVRGTQSPGTKPPLSWYPEGIEEEEQKREETRTKRAVVAGHDRSGPAMTVAGHDR